MTHSSCRVSLRCTGARCSLFPRCGPRFEKGSWRFDSPARLSFYNSIICLSDVPTLPSTMDDRWAHCSQSHNLRWRHGLQYSRRSWSPIPHGPAPREETPYVPPLQSCAYNSLDGRPTPGGSHVGNPISSTLHNLGRRTLFKSHGLVGSRILLDISNVRRRCLPADDHALWPSQEQRPHSFIPKRLRGFRLGRALFIRSRRDGRYSAQGMPFLMSDASSCAGCDAARGESLRSPGAPRNNLIF